HKCYKKIDYPPGYKKVEFSRAHALDERLAYHPSPVNSRSGHTHGMISHLLTSVEVGQSSSSVPHQSSADPSGLAQFADDWHS
ncbi:hypothetical protein LINPERPRIM_LOCUS38311, partial [Linum perenne]